MGICGWNRVCGSAGWDELVVGMWVECVVSCGSGVCISS